MSTVDFSGMPAACIEQIEGKVLPLLDAALVYSLGEYLAQDLVDRAKQGKMQLWVAAEGNELIGCVVTELWEYKRKTVCQIVVVAGRKFDSWKYGYALIEQWAYHRGAEEIRFYGRPGWEKVMNPEGFHKAYTVMTKELRDDSYTH